MIKHQIKEEGDNTDLLNACFDTHKDSFDGMFHTMLWRLLVDGSFKNTLCCFYPVHVDGGLMCAIVSANLNGYTPTPAFFKDRSIEQAYKLCDQMSEELFGLDDATCDMIVASSFAAKPTNNEEEMLDKARNQLIGFCTRAQGYSIGNLARDMGLAAEEWEQVKDDPTITDDLRAELDEHFYGDLHAGDEDEDDDDSEDDQDEPAPCAE